MSQPDPETNALTGHRIHIMGSSCAGKSSLAERLADIMSVPFVDLDALNWEPNWVSLAAVDPAELERRISEATMSQSWVVAGSYMQFSQRIFWAQLDTVVWLDLPLIQLIWRVIVRSWHRWRSKELLWGTNYERFWPQFMIWKKEESLLWWIVTQYQRKRRSMLAYMLDPRWRHIRFIRLTSSTEIQAFTLAVENAFAKRTNPPVLSGCAAKRH